MRLIDADKLKDTIHIHHYILRDEHGSTDNGMYTCGIDQAIDECETIEIVTCSECVYADKYCHCSMMLRWMTENDFCSKGKRKVNYFEKR